MFCFFFSNMVVCVFALCFLNGFWYFLLWLSVWFVFCVYRIVYFCFCFGQHEKNMLIFPLRDFRCNPRPLVFQNRTFFGFKIVYLQTTKS